MSAKSHAAATIITPLTLASTRNQASSQITEQVLLGSEGIFSKAVTFLIICVFVKCLDWLTSRAKA